MFAGSVGITALALAAPWGAVEVLEYFDRIDASPAIARLSVLALTAALLVAAWAHWVRSPALRTAQPNMHWVSLVMVTTGAFSAAVFTQLVNLDLVASPDASEPAPPLVLVTISAATLTPLVEELVFRGVIYQTIRAWLVGTRERWPSGPVQLKSLWPAIAVSSLLFGVAHYAVAAPVGIASLVGFGVVMALAYEVTGRLWVPILVHATFNLGVDLGGHGLATWLGVVPVAAMVVIAALAGLYVPSRSQSESHQTGDGGTGTAAPSP